ncbi:MAG: response regulator [Balneolaceae bacterium]|nr:response regulator [Balneolaceae bacterium]
MKNHHPHILLAEDNFINQKVADKILSKAGFTLDIASNGEKAVEYYSSKKYDVILMDVHMPLMDGYEATAKIREIEKKLNKHTHIIAMTGSVLEGDKEKCISAGMDDYLTKPINVDKLKKKINAVGDSAAIH